jgi:DNA-directed RNA polymerase specialized sigma24 family protein
MVTGDFGAALRAVYDGRATFDAVVREHRAHFRALAAQILRRWKLPPWVQLEDVEQDLLIAAWERLWDYDPARGTSIEGYVIWNAYDRAKKRAHKARGSKRSGNKADSNPSRFERGYAAVWGDDADRRSEEKSSIPAPQESGVQLHEAEELVADCVRDLREWHTVRAAREMGELEELLAMQDDTLVRVAPAVYEDLDAREDCEYADEVEAQCGTIRAATTVGARAAVLLTEDEAAA